MPRYSIAVSLFVLAIGAAASVLPASAAPPPPGSMTPVYATRTPTSCPLICGQPNHR